MLPPLDAAPIVLAQSTLEPSPVDVFIEDNGAIVGFVVLIGLMLFGLFGVRAALKGRERTEELAVIAKREGWRFIPERVNGADVDLPFATFKQGDGRGTGNVLRGEVKGHQVSAFDFWWFIEREREGYQTEGIDLMTALGTVDRTGGEVARRTYYSLTCAMAGVPNVLPHLIVTHENTAIRVLGAVAGSGLDLESEEFNRRYFVQCDDRRYATAFLDAQMQDFMLSCEGKYTFEARGRWLLIASSQLDAPRTAAMMGQVATYRACVPRIIDDMFPPLIPEGGR